MITPSDLSSMREVSSEALPGTAVIRSQSFASDGGGGGSLTWTPSGTVDCRIAPLTASEGERADRISADANYIVTLPFDAAVTTDSQLLIDSETYNVEAIRGRSWNVTTRVEVVKET